MTKKCYSYEEGMSDLDGVSFERVCEAFLPLIKNSARNCVKNTRGLNSEEVAVKLMTALKKAYDTFDPAKGVKFPAYAKRCINNAAVSEHRKGTKQRVATTVFDDAYGGGRTVFESRSVSLDNFDLSVLSKYEKEILLQRCRGLSYAEIAQKVGKNEKSVDNALKRAKAKLKNSLKVS